MPNSRVCCAGLVVCPNGDGMLKVVSEKVGMSETMMQQPARYCSALQWTAYYLQLASCAMSLTLLGAVCNQPVCRTATRHTLLCEATPQTDTNSCAVSIADITTQK